MNSSFEEGCSFKYCRICLRSDDDNTFSQLYDKGNEDMAEMFEAISGFDLTNDKGKYDILICNICSQRLRETKFLRIGMIHAERHFQCKRKDEGLYDDFVIGLNTNLNVNIKLEDSRNQDQKIDEFKPPTINKMDFKLKMNSTLISMTSFEFLDIYEQFEEIEFYEMMCESADEKSSEVGTNCAEKSGFSMEFDENSISGLDRDDDCNSAIRISCFNGDVSDDKKFGFESCHHDQLNSEYERNSYQDDETINYDINMEINDSLNI